MEDQDRQMVDDVPVPTDYASAMALAMLWATGKRSHWNIMMEHESTGAAYEIQGQMQFEPDRQKTFAESARADAAEVEKWCAVARGFASGELLELAKSPPQVLVPTTDKRYWPDHDAGMKVYVDSLDDDQLNVLASIIDHTGRRA